MAGLPMAVDWLDLFTHFLTLSLLAVGGAITVAPDMHRYLVVQHGWLSDPQFTASIALSQAAPGPNVLFIALLGFNIGINAAGGPAAGWRAWALGLFGVVVTMVAILLPSSVLTYTATRWAHQHRERRGVRAFKAGMAPIVIALLIATGWVLTAAHDQPARDWRLWLLTAVAALTVWRTKVHLLWLIGAGGVLGALGWV
ncbi:chromate transporter [Hydrogenophaga intermedia]|nr:chromate transporter [Hydrogenophaga intermedia]TMU77115.1 chromate transporter [Hydrogenophaga intermedia]